MVFDQKFLNWVTNSDHATTMMSTLEKGLDRMGFIRYDANCSKPCPSWKAKREIDGPEEEDLLFLDECVPEGIACGSCDGDRHIDVH